jgi:hypothetical protein
MDRSERMRRTQNKITQRFKLIRRMFPINENWNPMIDPGRSRKKHPLDCGKAKCKVCHRYKRTKRKRDKRLPEE